jgi:molybdenum cofactor sulfurtransferase
MCRLEPGTIDVYAIAALLRGFDTLHRLGGMHAICKFTFDLAQYFYRLLSHMRHANGRPVAVIYCNSDTFISSTSQGAIVNFNILDENHNHVGYTAVRLQHVRGAMCCTGGENGRAVHNSIAHRLFL